MEYIKRYADVSGVILAGGKSTRMGKDKAMLKMGSATLFSGILDVMQGLFSRVIIAGNRPDLTCPGVPCYPDRYPGSALGGLYTGLLAAETERIFVTSCDMPFPDAEIIRLILAVRSGHDAVVPKTPDGYEPLFALYHKSCLEIMREMLEQKNYCIYDFYPRMRIRYLGVEEMPPNWRWALMNVNTPEEYKSARAMER